MLIRQIEAYNRGFFAGACGYVDAAGDGEFSVALRTGVFDGEIGYVYAGCGIVDGSRAADEYDEIALKLKTVLSAFDGEAGAASSRAAQTSSQTTGQTATQTSQQTTTQMAGQTKVQAAPQVSPLASPQVADQTADQTSSQTTTAGEGEAR